MKRLFTLFAGLLLLGGSLSAQTKYTNLVANGNLEGDDLTNFWVQEWRNAGDETRTDGVPNVVEDPILAGNHCIAVRARSTEEKGSDLDRYDTQFFITVPADALVYTDAEGNTVYKQIRVTAKVRAEKAAHIGTQAHAMPGQYIGWETFGSYDVTTEWKVIEWEGVTPSGTNGDSGEPVHTVTFDLADYKDGNIYYFDDIKLEARDPKAPEEFSGWFNFLRKGTLSVDKIGNFTNFTGRDGLTGRDEQARLVTDADGEPALTVASIAYNGYVKNQLFDEEGNPQLDDEGNPKYEEGPVYVKENGDTLKNQNGNAINGIDDWQTQFFVTIPHKLTTGQKYKVVMWARADKEATIQSQIHRMPGDYLFYQLLGDLNLTTEWQKFEFEGDDYTINDSQNGGQTIAFNCNVLKEENNYYFRFEEFAVNKGDVIKNDLILGQETLTLPVPENGKDVTVKLDMSEMMALLEVEDLTKYLNDNVMCVKMEDEDFSGGLQATTGAFLDANGNWIDDESGINICFPEDDIEGKEVGINIYNGAESFAAGKTLDTKICFESETGWLYVYNIHFVDPAAYEDYTAISDVKVERKADKTLYDLTGRKVSKAGKGIYIMNGKKFLVK